MISFDIGYQGMFSYVILGPCPCQMLIVCACFLGKNAQSLKYLIFLLVLVVLLLLQDHQFLNSVYL